MPSRTGFQLSEDEEDRDLEERWERALQGGARQLRGAYGALPDEDDTDLQPGEPGADDPLGLGVPFRGGESPQVLDWGKYRAQPGRFLNITATIAGKEVKIQVPKNTSPSEINRRLKLRRAELQDASPPPTTRRGHVRKFVKELPWPLRVATEIGPQVAAGIAYGTPGAVTSEVASQATGLSPYSKEAIALAAIAPKALQLGGKALRGVTWTLKKFPMLGYKIAEQIYKGEKAFGPALKFMEVFRPQTSAKILFNRLAKNGILIPQSGMTSTKKVLLELKDELSKHPDAAGMDDMRTMVDSIFDKIFPKGKGPVTRAWKIIDPATGRPHTTTTPATPGADIPWDVIQIQIGAVGRAIGRLTRQGGPKLGAAKKFFGSVFDDLERLARTGGLPKGQLDLFNQARLSARRDFAVDAVQGWIRKSTSPVKAKGAQPAGGYAIDFEKVLRHLDAATTDIPRSTFEKNFQKALKFELPQIREWVKEMAELGPSKGVPSASLVIRGRQARLGAAITGAIGSWVPFAGKGQPLAPLAAGAGAILGAMAPELMAKILLTPHGRTVLKFMMRRGRRVFDPKTIHLIAQTLRGLGQETIRNIPLTNDERQARHLLMQAFKEERLQQRNKKKKRPYSVGSRP